MIGAVARKEFRLLWRDGRALTLLAMIVLLALAATLTSWNAVSSLERERSTAVVMDREIWDNQGEKNPHTAAHFARYAFKPTFNLAIFDPGLTAYMGNAIWLEAHYRDPAALRPVEDAVELQRIADLSPAWIIQVFAPALIILLLYAAVAGERESGTLRQLMSLGLRPRAFIFGKAVPVFLVSAGLVLAIILACAGIGLATGASIVSLPGSVARAAGLVFAYVVYAGIFVALALAVSARSARTRTALSLLLGFWVFAAIIVPRLAVDIGSALSPAPSLPEFAARLSDESAEPFWGSSEEAVALRQQVTDDILAEHGVEAVEELPINFDGYLLQVSEEYANIVFDELYSELWGGYEGQRDIARWMSVFSPTIALQNVSMAFAGSDLFSHRHYAEAAEVFRRQFVLLLNQEMIDHGGADGYAYMSGNDFWEQTPDFEYTPPGFAEALSQAWLDLVILLVWLFAALALVLHAARISFVQEAST